MTELCFANTTFIARPDRTLWHPDSGSLFLSDLHLGKAHLFRTAGIAVPPAMEHADLDRLTQAVQQTRANTLWILGDLFHHPQSIGERHRLAWAHHFAALKVRLCVILGNHDRHADALAQQMGFELHPEPTAWETLELAHHPAPESGRPRIAGHVHPQVIYQKRSDRLVLPCFAIVQATTLLLPAFTAFSGGPRFKPNEAQCFAITPTEVLSPSNLPPVKSHTKRSAP